MATKPTPGPKPDFQVVENHLKAQTEEGEISLDLRLPIPALEKFMEAQSLEALKIPRFMIELLPPEEGRQILALRDGAKGYQIVMKWAEAVGERLGASLGESVRSTESSESTDQPSATTSDTDSESLSTR